MTDFGFARMCWDAQRQRFEMSKTICGTPPFFSPQILRRQMYDPFAADSWAMGVMLFAMLNNKYPFHWDNEKEHLIEQCDPRFISTRFIKQFAPDLIDLIEKFFIIDETKRITMAQTLVHPWIVRKGK